jgi:PqqD family protein of HPr-rel-A system
VIRASAREVLVRDWDGRSVIYDCASGDTLFLDDLPSTVFAWLRQGPLDASGLVEQLAAHFEAPAEQLAQAVGQALDQLDKLGLVSQTSDARA